LESLPIVHRPDIQQGNVVTQEMVNQLQLGMSRHQVRYLLGTPMLIDVFHQNRWDYLYTLTEGWGDMQKKRVSLYFEGDELMDIQGDLQPRPEEADAIADKETLVDVPDYDGDDGIVNSAVNAVTGLWSDDPRPAAQEAKEEAEEEEEEEEEEETAPDSDTLDSEAMDETYDDELSETLETDTFDSEAETADEVYDEEEPEATEIIEEEEGATEE